MIERVVCVDAEDRCIGTEEKLKAHREGMLHRAFSVFVFNAEGQLLLQQRSPEKYHSGGLWTNTCCSHPRPDEDVEAAAARRLAEEMGIVCPLRKAFSFVYREDVAPGLVEHEFDHVFIGRFDGVAQPDPNEASDARWVDRAVLQRELEERPENYSAWFRLSIDRVLALA
jgi:isopentenyl-diphosphate Delta-isomerase